MIVHYFNSSEYNIPAVVRQAVFPQPVSRLQRDSISWQNGNITITVVFFLPEKLIFSRVLADISLMRHRKTLKKAERCAYIKACYLAEELKCFGYKTDCPLYRKSNGEYCNEEHFNAAVDKLIDRTRAKYARLNE